MKEGKHTKTLAKIQVCAIFRMRLGEMVYVNLESFVWRRHYVGASQGHQHGGRKPTEISVTAFCYESLNSSLEKLIDIKVQ